MGQSSIDIAFLPAPLRPICRHVVEVTGVRFRHGVLAGDFVKRIKQVLRVFLKFYQNKRHGSLSHFDDVLIGWMLGDCGATGKQRRFLFPTLKKCLEAGGEVLLFAFWQDKSQQVLPLQLAQFTHRLVV